MKARIVITASVVAVVVAAASFWLVSGREGTPGPAAANSAAVATAEVVRTDLSDTRTLRGSLGYGAARQVKGHGGTVTWLPATGATIKRGEQLLRVDDRPVTLFYGDLPLYRDLNHPRATGRDVAVVADNLRALGYEVGSLGGNRDAPRYTETLIGAVKRWQKDTGRADSGAVTMNDVIVLAGEVRVDSLTAQTGDDAAAPLMTVTPTRKVITAEVELGDVSATKTGTAVTITMPDGSAIAGRVGTVGTALRTDANDQEGPRTFTVTVTADDPQKLTAFDTAEVSVVITTATRQGVLAVPVGSLLALSEGGYAVQLPDGTLVAVTTGMFAKGLVEVTGEGLAEGQVVVTTS
ncbi:efflux RND transporter periplasmic adaptor subunit [Catenuloplanes atrovinosus]|uniref:Peptidoglycan binding-like domain-containing protein n=1 Tax=Catenuloplanes atrovinosus TaxID=137266 RepID=A0AAE3YQ22_9ACTN|nr:efflux RND transporter periplasmic adaptor subunit [Catenuloplanes atrovinosus]MDR7277177.1 hypothetical protein [Catenuloplanes atrovinosus]